MKTAIHLSLVLVASLFLGGCIGPNAESSFNQLYQGYPCNGHCDQFKSGYEIAQKLPQPTPDNCGDLPMDQRTGCLSYVHEYALESNQPAGYAFP